MSAANEISLDELERLIRILGMLGSAHEGEVVNAGRAAVRWVLAKGTDWRTLLTPAPEQAVTGVVTTPDYDALREAQEADRVTAFKNGYQAGLRDMAQQLRAQAAMAAAPPTWTTMAASSAGNAVHAAQAPAGAGQGAGTQTPSGSATGAASGRVWPAGSWQAVAQALLDRHAAVPGGLRSREEIFVTDILQRGFPSLTPAQEAWLRDIAGRNAMSW